MTITGAQTQITQAVVGWDNMHTTPHRFGGIEYVFGAQREIGHVHGDSLVDIPFPSKVRNELVANGRAEKHHILPDTGWVSFYIREAQDVAKAIDLLRISYDIANRQKL